MTDWTPERIDELAEQVRRLHDLESMHLDDIDEISDSVRIALSTATERIAYLTRENERLYIDIESRNRENVELRGEVERLRKDART